MFCKKRIFHKWGDKKTKFEAGYTYHICIKCGLEVRKYKYGSKDYIQRRK